MLSKRSFILGAAFFTVLIVTGWACLQNAKMAQGREIVTKIESFKKDRGRLPESLGEIGIEEKEEGPVYYRRESSEKYVLWYGTSLGESVKYDSETKIWK